MIITKDHPFLREIREDIAATLVDGYAAAVDPAVPFTAPDVLPYGVELDRIDKPVVLVELTAVTPGVSHGRRRCELRLILVSSVVTPGEAEAELDLHLDRLLVVLDADRSILWSRAERATYADTNPCYSLTIERQI